MCIALKINLYPTPNAIYLIAVYCSVTKHCNTATVHCNNTFTLQYFNNRFHYSTLLVLKSMATVHCIKNIVLQYISVDNSALQWHCRCEERREVSKIWTKISCCFCCCWGETLNKLSFIKDKNNTITKLSANMLRYLCYLCSDRFDDGNEWMAQLF